MARRLLKIDLDRKSKRLISKLKTDSQRANFQRQLRRGLEKIAQRTASHVVRTQLSGQKLNRRTGQTARLIQGVAVVVSGKLGIRVGILNSDRAVVLAAHEFGAKIRPVRAKALAQPLAPKALTPAGVPRFDGPRDYPRPLQFVPFKGGKVVIGALYEKDDLEKLEDQGKALDLFDIDAVFLLRTGTNLPARAPLETGFIERLDTISEEVADLIERAFGL